MAISWRVSGSPFTSRAEAANAIKTADLLLVIALFLIMIGGYHVHFMLTAGDWDFWIDWKDRRFWPTVLPIMLITFVAAAQYFFWEHFRLPFGATFVSLALLTGEWIDRYVSFWGWTFFPIGLCWPTSIIPMALYIDIVLLLKSWIVTAIKQVRNFSASVDRRFEDVRILPIIVAKLELCNIERHIFSAHFVGCADYAVFEYRPNLSLHLVSVCVNRIGRKQPVLLRRRSKV